MGLDVCLLNLINLVTKMNYVFVIRNWSSHDKVQFLSFCLQVQSGDQLILSMYFVCLPGM